MNINKGDTCVRITPLPHLHISVIMKEVRLRKVIVTTLVQDELNQVSYYFIYQVMSGILYFTLIPLLSGNVAKRLIIICLLIRLI